VYYPESDGKPMAETEPHGDVLANLKFKLNQRYRFDPWASTSTCLWWR